MRVAVIGGGIIGCSIAWRLALRGAAVTVYEAGRIGGEASTAGAGMLAPGGEVDRPGAFARLLVESLRIYPGFLAELSAQSGVPVDYRACGALEFARTPEEWTRLEERITRQRALGIRAEADRARSAVIYPDDALVDPGGLMSALRAACGKAKVEIREGAPVRRVDLTAAGAHVLGTGYDRAVLAAGAWSSRIAVGESVLPKAFAVKGHLAGFGLEPGRLPHILRHGHTYLLQRSSGFTVLGSDEQPGRDDRTVEPERIEDLVRRGQMLSPVNLGEPVRVWTGLRPGIEQDEPAAGRLDNTAVWLAYGHYRNGILAAPATAAQIAEQITASSSETDPHRARNSVR